MHTETVNNNNGDNNIYFRISRSVNNKMQYQHLLICAEMQGISDFTDIDFDTDAAGNYNNKIVSAPTLLSTDKFSSGILHVTVFNNETGTVLAQRLVLLHKKNDLPEINVNASQLNFLPRSKNNFFISLPAEMKQNFSVSVTDADAEDKNEQDNNIVSNILLNADLKNNFKHAGFYFNNNIPNDNAIDLLLITKKWSRFSWEKLFAGNFPLLKYYPEQSMMIKGRAFCLYGKNKTPMHGGEFSLMIKAPEDSLMNVTTVPVDSLGFFTIANLLFHDSAQVYVQNSSEKDDKKITVEFEKTPVDSVLIDSMYYSSKKIINRNNNAVREIAAQHLKLNNNNIVTKKSKLKDTVTLKSVTVTGYRKNHIDSVLENYTTPFFGNPRGMAETLDFTNDKATKNLYAEDVIHYLEGRIKGVVYNYVPLSLDKQHPSIVAGSIPIITWRMANGLFIKASGTLVLEMNAPAFFLNEQLLNEGSEGYENAINLLMNVNMAEVALVRIFEPGTMPLVSGNAPHGAIAIYTKNGSEGKFLYLENRFDKIKKAGYSFTQDFSSPDYSVNKNAAKKDTRKTLYWNPQLETDSTTHTATFSFFNNDVAKHFHIIIEGIDKNGKILRTDKIF